jgi:hypothetical protein
MNRLNPTDSELNDLGMTLYWRFTADAIEATPNAPGVFAFFSSDGRHLLLGSAAKSLQVVLSSHWKGLEGRQTCGAAYVSWELHANPMTLEAELAKRYIKKYGRVPRRRVG